MEVFGGADLAETTTSFKSRGASVTGFSCLVEFARRRGDFARRLDQNSLKAALPLREGGFIVWRRRILHLSWMHASSVQLHIPRCDQRNYERRHFPRL